MGRLRHLAKEFGGVHASSTIGQVDMFRPDSWQWLLAKPDLALRAAVFMRAGLRALSGGQTKFDTRIAIGIGTVDSVARRRISDSRGEAFTRSGKTLDGMGSRRLAYASGGRCDAVEEWLSGGLAPLLDCIVTDSTAVEARAVHGALMGWTQEEIAAHWPILAKTGKRPSRQAVMDSLRRAHWSSVETALWLAESKVKQVLGLAYDKNNS